MKQRSFSYRFGSPAVLAIVTVCAILAPSVRAASPASDTACNDTIANGNNGGSGFSAWTGISIGSGGGVYTGSDSGLGSNGCSTAWGIYSGDNAVLTSVQRPFTNSTTLAVGQILSVDMQNGGINSGGSEGLSLYNSSGNAVWELYFSGGANNWTINDNSGALTSTIPYAGSGCRVTFALTSASTYSFTVQVPVGGTLYGPFTGTLINPSGGQAITQLRFFTYNIGSGNNLQFNNLSVTCPTPTFSVQPQPQTVTTNVLAVFSVQNPESVAYQWQVNKGSGFNNVTGSDGTGGTSSTFVTVATTAAMNGYQYDCIITDPCGDTATSTTNTLTVSSPFISAQPAATTTATYPSTTPAMTVAASGTDGGGLNYAWRKRGSGWGNA